jgi:hypothetical protein
VSLKKGGKVVAAMSTNIPFMPVLATRPSGGAWSMAGPGATSWCGHDRHRLRAGLRAGLDLTPVSDERRRAESRSG